MNTLYKEKIEFWANQARKFRDELGITQTALAAKTNVSKSLISLMEHGIKRPSFEFLYYAHKNLNLNLHWFLHDEGEMFISSKGPNINDIFPDLPEDNKWINEMLEYMHDSGVRHGMIAKWILLKEEIKDYITSLDARREKEDKQSDVG